MDICIYDNTLNGLFTAVFELYKSNANVSAITGLNSVQPAFDTKIINVGTDCVKSKRIRDCVIKYTGYEGLSKIRYAFASGKDDKELIIYNYLKIVFLYKEKAPFILNDKYVIAFYDLSGAVALECHRMLGFIRFKECEGGFFYADFMPDGNITEFIMPHFIKRFGGMNLIIHDVKRNIIGIYNGKIYKVFKNDRSLTVYLTNGERAFSKIWKMYYKKIAIEGRKNIKLMKRFLPVRYWKTLTEKDEEIKI